MDNTDIQNILAEELGIAYLPLEEQERVRNTIGEAVIVRVAMAASNALTEEDRTALEQLNTQDEIQQFLSSHIPNLDEIAGNEAKRTVAEFKQQLLGA